MDLLVKGVHFRIPYERIYSWERYFLQAIQGDKIRLIEAKLDDRLTVITLCYLMAALVDGQQGQQQILWLCQNEQRKQLIMTKAQKLKVYLKQHNPLISNLRIRKSQAVQQNSLQDNIYLELKVQTIQQHLRSYIADFHITMLTRQKAIRGFNNFHEFNSCKMILIQTTDILGLSQCLFPYEINQTYLRRAAMQVKRLDKYYHFNPNPSDPPSSTDQSNRQFNQPQHCIYNQQLQQLFSHLYNEKRNLTIGVQPDVRLTPDSRYICDMMVNIEFVGFVIACFAKITNYDLSKDESIDFCMSLEQLQAEILRQTRATSEQLLTMGRMIDDLLAWRPPWLPSDSIQIILQADYIRQICRFVESVILWNRVIRQCITEKTESLIAIKQNHLQKPSIVLKIVLCDKSLPLHVLQLSTKNLLVVQEVAAPEEYLRQVLLLAQFLYLPSNCHYFSKFTLFGMIVAYNDSNSVQLLTSEETALSLLAQNQSQDHILQKIEDQRVQILGYGSLLCDICDICPGGIIAYFPNREMLQRCIMVWSVKNDTYNKILQNRPVFVEQDNNNVNMKTVFQYRQNCNKGKGGLLLMSVNSDMAKAEKFHEQTHCIVFFGLPWEGYEEYNITCNFAGLKIDQSRTKYALYKICQYLSNCINSWQEIKTVLLVDQRYEATEVKRWLPFFFEQSFSNNQAIQRLVEIYQKTSSLIRRKAEQEIQFQKGTVNEQSEMEIE